MYKFVIIALMMFVSFANAQTKKTKKPKVETIEVDSLASDSTKLAIKELKIPRQFLVYTKKAKNNTERIKLCFNLITSDTVLNYCMNDSICRDPEVFKLLFQEKKADTVYVLIYVDAFSKPLTNNPKCESGKETKLFFVRWNTKTNKSIWKQRTISSCMKGITDMTKDPIEDWDKTSPLVLNYYKGGDDFIEITFDPKKVDLGFQSSSENEAK